MTTEATTSLPPRPTDPQPAAPAVFVSRPVGWLAVGGLVLLWSFAIYRLGTLWYSNPNYAYGWFVPLLCLALFWERWKCRPAPGTPEASAGPLIVWGMLALMLLPSYLFREVIPYWRFAG